MNKRPHAGTVILAGAGPGDPELITVKAARCLQQADVVLTDRLVSEDILNAYVPAEAEIIYVGKQGRQAYSTPQKNINELIVDYALQGKSVVRLKGGDTSFFANIMDELEALTSNNIPYEIIPGITAASGAAAYAGIPLTARGHAVAVRFLTCYKDDLVKDPYWKDLAATDDTLVFYMTSGALDKVVERLVTNEISPGKLLAVIEQATTPCQKVHTFNLYEYHGKSIKPSFLSPSLPIIGEVVKLHEQFAWLANSPGNEYYFKPVSKVAEQIKMSA